MTHRYVSITLATFALLAPLKGTQASPTSLPRIPDIYLHGERPGTAKPLELSERAPLVLHLARDEFALVMAAWDSPKANSLAPLEGAALILEREGKRETVPIELITSLLGVQRLSKSSTSRKPAGEVPDIVVPNELARSKDFHLPPQNRPSRPLALFELHPLPTTSPGTYRGRIQFRQGTSVFQIPMELVIHQTTLPKTLRLKTSFGFAPWSALKRHYGKWSPEENELYRKYFELASENRIDLHKIYLKFPKVDSAASRSDLLAAGDPKQSFLSQWELVSGGSLGDDGFRWSVTDLPVPETEKKDPQEAFWRALDRSVSLHGLTDSTYVYFWDEPRPADVLKIAVALRKIRPWAPHLRFLVTTNYQAPLEGLVDIWCPNLSEWAQPGHPSPDQYQELRHQHGGDYWLYTSCSAHGCGGEPGANDIGIPDLVTDRPPVYARSFAWAAFLEGARGILYYNTVEAYTAPDNAPWTDPFLFTGNGEGNLFYPCTPETCGVAIGQRPLASLRLKIIRDGLEDAEILALARDQGLPVESWARLAYPSVRHLPSSTAELEKVKIRALEAMDSAAESHHEVSP